MSQNSEKYLFECAELFLKFAHFKKARDIYAEILKKDLKNPEALKGLGICFYREKQWEPARKCFSAYLQFSKRLDGKVWLNSCYLLSGEAEVADSFFQEHLKNELDSVEFQSLSDSVPSDVWESVMSLRRKAS